MQICFAFWQNPAGYSGGRYYAWLLALSLARHGNQVFIWTNAMPKFIDDFGCAVDALTICIDENFQCLPAGEHDLLVIVPHHGTGKHRHFRWLAAAAAGRIPIAFLSFETPNWLAAEGVPTRGLLDWIPWRVCGEAASRILCMSKVGKHYAALWYSKSRNEKYSVCTPPCNEKALGTLTARRDIDFLVFARVGRRDFHKGGHLLPKLIAGLSSGTSVMVFGELERISPQAHSLIASAAKRANVRLSFSGSVNDVQKLRLFSRSRVVGSLSLFEGFGYPAMEARVCGAQLVAFALPIYRELHERAPGATLVPIGDIDAFARAVTCLLSDGKPVSEDQVEKARADFSWDQCACQFESAMRAIPAEIRYSGVAQAWWGLLYGAYAVEACCREVGKILLRRYGRASTQL